MFSRTFAGWHVGFADSCMVFRDICRLTGRFSWQLHAFRGVLWSARHAYGNFEFSGRQGTTAKFSYRYINVYIYLGRYRKPSLLSPHGDWDVHKPGLEQGYPSLSLGSNKVSSPSLSRDSNKDLTFVLLILNVAETDSPGLAQNKCGPHFCRCPAMSCDTFHQEFITTRQDLSQPTHPGQASETCAVNHSAIQRGDSA